MRLAAALERLKPDTFLVLTVSVPRPAGPGPYVQYANSGRRGFRAEASGNHFLAAPHALSPEAEERLGEFGCSGRNRPARTIGTSTASGPTQRPGRRSRP